MITIKVKPITFKADVRIDDFSIENEEELNNFRRCKYPADEDGMQQRLLVQLDVNGVGREFICCGNSLGKCVVSHVERIVAMMYMHCVLR